jgi:hypothetical protein
VDIKFMLISFYNVKGVTIRNLLLENKKSCKFWNVCGREFIEEEKS